MKVLAKSPQVLVASAAFLQDTPLPLLPADLGGLATIHWGNPLLQYLWDLTGPDGATAQVAHTPRLVSDDMSTLKNAALAGVGIANLPQVVVKDELADGRLIAVLPEWQPAEGVITAVFPSRRGLMPSVRSLIDFLGEAFEAP